jgi:hypothetical protein
MNTNLSRAASAATEAERPQVDTILLKDLKSERRRGVRYLCQIKTLYNSSGEKSDLYDETWNVGRIIDISANGIALLLKQRMPLGAVISLAPMISSWNGDSVLAARVANVRPGPNRRWCAGCEFLKPLTEGQLNVFLQNSH